MPTKIGSISNKNNKIKADNKKSANKKVEAAKNLSRKEKERKLLEELGTEQPGMNKRKQIAIGAAAGVLGTTAILIPTVKYITESQKQIITMKVQGTHYETYKLEVKRGSLVKNLKVFQITGYKFVGLYKDEACTIPYNETEKITKNSTVYCKYEPITYTVSYPMKQEGYVVNAEQIVEYGNKFIFTVTLLDEYNKSDVVVKVNGDKVYPNEYGQYIISFVKSDLNITVGNVIKNKPTTSINLGNAIVDFEIDEDVTLKDVLEENEMLIKKHIIETTLTNNPNIYTKEQLNVLKISELLAVTSSGIYTDETCTQEIDLTKPLLEYGEEMSMYIGFATLNKLSFKGGSVSAKDENITGDVVVPKAYLDSTNTSGITSVGYFGGGPSGKVATKISSIILPDTITNIGMGVFVGCVELTEITIPRSVTSIGSSAFSGCKNLLKTNYLGDIDSWVQIYFSSSDGNPVCYSKNLYINGKIVSNAKIDLATKINGYAFAGCDSLTEVTIGGNVTSVGHFAFSGCLGLKQISISDNVTYLGMSAFQNCNNVTDVFFQDAESDWKVSSRIITSSELQDSKNAAALLKDTTMMGWNKVIE